MFEYSRTLRTFIAYGVLTDNWAWQTVMTAKIIMTIIAVLIVDKGRKSSTMEEMKIVSANAFYGAPLSLLGPSGRHVYRAPKIQVPCAPSWGGTPATHGRCNRLKTNSGEHSILIGNLLIFLGKFGRKNQNKCILRASDYCWLHESWQCHIHHLPKINQPLARLAVGRLPK
jgi:hypothetical protein